MISGSLESLQPGYYQQNQQRLRFFWASDRHSKTQRFSFLGYHVLGSVSQEVKPKLSPTQHSG